MNISVLP